MKYARPKIILVGDLSRLIQGQQLKRDVVIESYPDLYVTAPAYEADE